MLYNFANLGAPPQYLPREGPKHRRSAPRSAAARGPPPARGRKPSRASFKIELFFAGGAIRVRATKNTEISALTL